MDDKPSSTALLIARCILLAAQDCDMRKLVADGEPEIIRRILRQTDNDRLFQMALSRFPRSILLGLERMYLEERSNEAILRQIAPYCGKLIFTFMEKAPDGSIDFRNQSPLIGSWLNRNKEPFLWGITKGELPDFLEKCGFRCLEIIDDIRLRREILAPRGIEQHPLAQGECICIAEPALR